MTTFNETNAVLIHNEHDPSMVYAACKAGNCTWVGPWRTREAVAKRDAVRHHDEP